MSRTPKECDFCWWPYGLCYMNNKLHCIDCFKLLIEEYKIRTDTKQPEQE